MSYATINTCASDPVFSARLTAAVAQERLFRNEPGPPQQQTAELVWAVSATSDIEAAYAYALDNDNTNPGGDETVITDQMILSAVQANWPPSAETPG